MIILIIYLIIIALTWNIHFYTTKNGKDVSVGKFILGITLVILGFYNGFKTSLYLGKNW